MSAIVYYLSGGPKRGRGYGTLQNGQTLQTKQQVQDFLESVKPSWAMARNKQVSIIFVPEGERYASDSAKKLTKDVQVMHLAEHKELQEFFEDSQTSEKSKEMKTQNITQKSKQRQTTKKTTKVKPSSTRRQPTRKQKREKTEQKEEKEEEDDDDDESEMKEREIAMMKATSKKHSKSTKRELMKRQASVKRNPKTLITTERQETAKKTIKSMQETAKKAKESKQETSINQEKKGKRQKAKSTKKVSWKNPISSIKSSKKKHSSAKHKFQEIELYAYCHKDPPRCIVSFDSREIHLLLQGMRVGDSNGPDKSYTKNYIELTSDMNGQFEIRRGTKMFRFLMNTFTQCILYLSRDNSKSFIQID